MRFLAGALIIVAAAACTSSPSTETTASTVPFSTPSLVVTDQLLAELDLELLARSVSRLRQLDFLQPVSVQIIADPDYQMRVAELTGGPPDTHSRWLQLLGLLPEGVDAGTATTRLLQTSVAIYDAEANRVLVRAGAGIDPYVESVVVHELVHALQRQHFGAVDTGRLDGDLGYVYTALVDGDAERVARRFIGELSQADEFAYEEGRLNASEGAAAIRGGTPGYVFDSLSQPGGDGVRFLQGLDYQTVDGFFADLTELTSLPVSSEAMIIPEADTEIPTLELPRLSLPSYQPVQGEGTLGVGRLRILLGQVLEGQLANPAVLGWAADRLEVHASGEDVVLAYVFLGDRAEDAQELAAAFQSLLDNTLVPGAYGSVRVSDRQVLVLAASDSSQEAELDEIYGDFGDEVFLVPLG
ncbi:MAG: hypothetical protein OER12_08065 [Acidimicrobiia bacterium]|nr:hypothetical protein [Acidimicrobiia bacterium]